MPTRKIGDAPKVCTDPSHDPPSHMLYEDGVWEHVCPSCGATKVFTVMRPRYGGGDYTMPFSSTCP